MVMIEAMACGTPVLATAHGSVPEVVADGLTGFVRATPDALVDTVQRFGEIDRRACRRWVAERFSADAMTEGYERLAPWPRVSEQRAPAHVHRHDLGAPGPRARPPARRVDRRDGGGRVAWPFDRGTTHDSRETCKRTLPPSWRARGPSP